ncbi:MAG: GTP cyclohydrolase I FolE2, partial [Elusimicrobia bacterium]|nr:GTP cyclohydrolase I FolE2 [Elusimicrobiota bacterium]MBD3412702.1 GTP cyclohydrolase I FolE2 [Elusimicrobiota bacterium]
HHNRQHTVADINMYVTLPHRYKGTHMSRFVEILSRHSREIDIRNIGDILETMKKTMRSTEAHLEMQFPYFIEKKAPISKKVGQMDYICQIKACLNRNNHIDVVVGVSAPVNALCPCSKEISEYGAHNQRGIVSLRVRMKSFIWIEELIQIIEKSASSSVYSLLKRVDEKYITEKAYRNPVFVEDIVRKISVKLMKDRRVAWFHVESENMESIHNHNAYALVERHIR